MKALKCSTHFFYFMELGIKGLMKTVDRCIELKPVIILLVFQKGNSYRKEK